MAVAVGYKMAGWVGSFVALGGLLFPSTVMMMILILFFTNFKDSPRLQSFLRGVRPAVMALLLVVAYDVGKTSVDSVATAILGATTLGLILFANVHPALALLLSGVVGLIFL
jgi:chromate transporter